MVSHLKPERYIADNILKEPSAGKRLYCLHPAKTLERDSLLFRYSHKTPAYHGMLAIKLLRSCTLLKLQSLPQYQIFKQLVRSLVSSRMYIKIKC